jgi:hypothetical protein
MSTTVTATLIFLAGVFGWSGFAKLFRPVETAIALRDFGLTSAPLRWAGRAAAAYEIGLAVGLGLASWFDLLRLPILIVAGATLFTFAAILEVKRRNGARFACMCFGASDRPLDRFAVGRASGLAVAAISSAVASLATTLHQSAVKPYVAHWCVVLAVLSVCALGSSISSMWKRLDPYDLSGNFLEAETIPDFPRAK